MIFSLSYSFGTTAHSSSSMSRFNPIVRAIACGLLILLLPCSLCASPLYEYCKNNNNTCGNITFPFPFGVGNHGDYACGLPNFHINCVANLPMIDISGQNYIVLQVSPISYTLIIVNDFEEGCQISNNSLVADWNANTKKIFEVTYQQSKALYIYNCGATCLPYLETYLNPSCKLEGTPTVQETVTKWNINEDNLYQNCSDCFQTNGYCGYNSSNLEFVCFCKDGVFPNRCPKGSSRNIAAIIGGSLAGFFLIAAVLLFCRLRYQKRNIHPPPAVSPLIAKDVSSSYSLDVEAGVQRKIGNLPIFSYQILEQATNNFDEEKMLGDGGFGSVYLGKLPDGRNVAIKRLYQNNYRKETQFINEIQILSSLHHPNLVRLYGCTAPESQDLLLVYEYVPNGTVADHLHGERKGKGLDWKIRLKISLETAQALAFLHSQTVLHRDVKTTNILLDENYKVKVADFGLSRFMPPNVTHVSTAPQGTPGYLDPEYHECFQLTEKSDVYSFGVVLVEIISGKLAVDINRNRREIALSNMALAKIRDGSLNELVDPCLGFDANDEVKTEVTAVAELAFRCLQSTKDDRPCMKEILDQLEGIHQKWNDGCDPKDKLFSGIGPPSPTSVQDKWPSMNTTPNNSA